MSSKVEVSSNGDQVVAELKAKLQALKGQTKLSVFRALTLIEAEILQNIRIKSGLKVRSGSLLNSIGASKKVTEEADGTISGQIGSQGVPYAAIHEFGGTTPPRRIEPKKEGGVLAFQIKGQQVFAKFVDHPGSKIPARPYLRPALAAKEDEILKNFGLMIQAIFTKG
jgi:phage gpG-like protein